MILLRNHFTTVPALAVTGLLLLAFVVVTIRTATAQTTTTPTCANGTAVPDPDNNPGLVSDCEALLEARDTQTGTAALQGIAPTATVIPTGTSPPPTPTSTVPSAPTDTDDNEDQPGGLFSEVEGEPPHSTDVEILASRLVGIDFGQIAQITNPPIDPKDSVTGTPPTPHTLVLNLFDDVVFTGIVEHVEPTASGHALWGSLQGEDLGTMTLVVNGKIVVGTVRTPDAVYSIRTAGDGKYVIRQIDESSLPPLGEPLDVPSSPRDAPSQAGDIPPDDGSVIDVMVVYTPLAKHREGGRAAIEALIDLFVTETNQAYANSGVIHRIRLVLRKEVDYIEDGDSIVDLRRLREDSDGYMDHVHELRDLYAADLVHIVVGISDIGGRAYESSDESSAFGLTLYLADSLGFAHELGHNMGLHHDRYEVGVPLKGSHFGYVNQRMFEPNAPESARWVTIMAYGKQCGEVGGFGCYRVPYFSNPDLTYNGDPMGVPADHPSTGVDGPADAVGTLNDRREITANFRRSSTSPTPRVGLTLSRYWLSENGGVSSVKAILHRPSGGDTVLTVSASPEDAITLSANRTLTIPAGQTVSDDTVTIAGANDDDQTGDVTVTISATAANSNSLGVIAPEPVVLAVVDDETTPEVSLSLSPSEVIEGEGRDGGRTFLIASLNSRSSAETKVTVSASPVEAVEEIWWSPLTIPAGQTASAGWTWLYAVNDTEFKEAKKTVTVSGAARNSLGVTGPQSVTLTIIDDDGPIFADDSISYTFTAGVTASRVLPEAEYGNEPLTYSSSPAVSKGVTFAPGPPARIGVSEMSVAAGETSYTLTATDAEGDTDTMTVNITVLEGVCPNSAAVSAYTDPSIVRDCEALLASKDVLSGDQPLNWSADLSMGDWLRVEIADSRVVEIDLSDLGLTGTIPGEIGGLSVMQSLILNSNHLQGPIPAELGRLSKLRKLTAYGNELTGEIPGELGNLASLQSLSFNGNELTGTIPTELGDLISLTRLDLAGNKLTGGIPAELGRLSNLQTLYLPVNQLTGPIPVELGDLARLEYLDVNSNKLDGEIPHELGRVTNLEVLNLNSNRLTGTIPPQLGNLGNLYSLVLSYNQLVGEIPTELSNLSNLRVLSLYNVELTGCIPEGLRDVEISDLDRLGLPFCDDEIEQSDCSSGTAVPDAANNPGLVSDCEALLASRDTLAGTATLNWSADTPIADWEGVVLEGTPQRVTSGPHH